MKIRYVTPTDDPVDISEIYEKSWKYTYRNIIPADYLDSIPAGRWANGINKSGMHSLVITENQRARKFYEKNGFVCTDHFLDDNIGGKNLREIMYILNR